MVEERRSQQALIVGVVNATPDSFSDGGRYSSVEAAQAAGEKLAGEGADIVEIGGESTRPGAAPVSLEEELRRVIPVVHRLRQVLSVPLSVDTAKAPVAEKALDEGVEIINDVTSLQGDPSMADVIGRSDCSLVLMHMKGTPRDMQRNPFYRDVIGEITAFFRERIECAETHGIERSRLILDPGIGFGKRLEDNLRIINELDRFAELGCPLMIGVSRKSFIGSITGRPVDGREIGTVVANCFALLRGVRYIRVHNVAYARDLVRMAAAITGTGAT